MTPVLTNRPIVGTLALMLLAVALATPTNAGARRARAPVDSTLARAQRLFEAGRFDRAEVALQTLRSTDPRAAKLRGRLSLLANRNTEAERWLKRALRKNKGDSTITAWLAESHYRRGQFAQAAKRLRTIGEVAKARKLESFGRRKPSRLIEGGNMTSVPFVFTDPLPIIEAKVNDGPTILLVLDTGGGELMLDPEFAERMGVENFGNVEGLFAGDPRATMGHGRIDSLMLGEFTIAHVPVRLLPTAKFAALAGGKTVHGILGTILLYRFLATIDYPGGQLVLRRPGRATSQWLAQEIEAENSVTVPFWMSGSHFIVAHGMVNASGPHLLFVDTGIAGGGFTGPASIMTEAQVLLFKDQAIPGVGSGGAVRYVPLVIEQLKLGDALRKNIPGVFGVFPPALEYGQGFRIAGLISHQFFRSYAMTLDFEGMRLILREAKEVAD